ncbi:Phage protein [Yersinia phage fPS-53]|uniref:Phage protein n=4 Tax=Helsettvirus TaxID=2732684 RepID=A0A2H1UJ74_9CAUD|nr:Phage protein [Yersinia phage fPS-53]YP_009799196.1 Phage protein [Yersinia phage fPS-54-ocr]SOO46604.1 Phage protein [Yersinia phage fPS-89]SOO56436.1 Phage protein [Yersinia phage fPS-85]SOO56486.1 Phage protein [Yersinia phage fPS-53]SOP75986.1 Phage protein [Yersinia phage fPS-54-ocr]
MTKFVGKTINLSDTIDQYSRKVHINVRNGKVTLVYRWKDHQSTKAHTQRMTLDDVQTARLVASIAVAVACAVGEDKARELVFNRELEDTAEDLAIRSDAP